MGNHAWASGYPQKEFVYGVGLTYNFPHTTPGFGLGSDILDRIRMTPKTWQQNSRLTTFQCTSYDMELLNESSP